MRRLSLFFLAALVLVALPVGRAQSETPAPVRLLLAGDDREIGFRFAPGFEEFLNANGITTHLRIVAVPDGTFGEIHQKGYVLREFNRQRADFVILSQSAAAWRADPLASRTALDALDTEFRKLSGVTVLVAPAMPARDPQLDAVLQAAARQINAPLAPATGWPERLDPETTQWLYKAWRVGLDVARMLGREPASLQMPAAPQVGREVAEGLWRAALADAEAAANGRLEPGWEEITGGLLRALGGGAKLESGLGGGIGQLVALPRRGTLFATLNGTHGVLRSDDGGDTWHRTQAPVRGRGYGGHSAALDPVTERFAIFMIVNRGPAESAFTVDGGEMWRSITRPAGVKHDGWTWGSVDWASTPPQVMLGKEHHNYTGAWLSHDAGATWEPLPFKGRNLGVIDATTFVATPGVDGEGIHRSTDAGKTWTPVSNRRINGKVPVRYGRNVYWTGEDGLLVSHDAGATWELSSEPLPGALWGPYFGADEQSMLVVARDGFFLRRNGSPRWERVAPFFSGRPGRGGAKYDIMHPTISYAWDPKRGWIYCGVVGGGLFRLAVPAATR